MAWISPLGMPVQQFSYEKKPNNVDKYDCWEMHLNSTKGEILSEFVGYCPQVRDTPEGYFFEPVPMNLVRHPCVLYIPIIGKS